jgi:hypothetical protein
MNIFICANPNGCCSKQNRILSQSNSDNIENLLHYRIECLTYGHGAQKQYANL